MLKQEEGMDTTEPIDPTAPVDTSTVNEVADTTGIAASEGVQPLATAGETTGSLVPLPIAHALVTLEANIINDIEMLDPTICPPLPALKKPRILDAEGLAAVTPAPIVDADSVMQSAAAAAANAAMTLGADPQIAGDVQAHVNASRKNPDDRSAQAKNDSDYLASDDEDNAKMENAHGNENDAEAIPYTLAEKEGFEAENSTYPGAPYKRKRESALHRMPWSAKIALLVAYKEKNKHCRVPQRSKEHPELAQFTKKMREYYRLQKTGHYKGKLLTPERVKELEDAGFEWEVRKVPNKSFEERMHDLGVFKEKNEHCNVPRVYKEDVSLGRWCHVMRCSYWQVKVNKKPMYKIRPEEIQMLEDIGFLWRIKKPSKAIGPKGEPNTYKSKQGKKTTSFEERIDQLTEYKKEHGHVRVTMGQNKNLAIFVNHMRGARRDPKKTNGVRLTAARIAALDVLEFDWAPPRTKIRWSANEGREENITFEERIAQLEAFKEFNGPVPVSRKHDRSLSAFCHHMREDRNKSKLSDEQIKALDEVGFIWEVDKSDKSEQPWVTFQDRIEQLKAFNVEHGHFRVTAKDDRALSLFCSDVRSAHRPESKKTLTEERTKALDDIGFEWNPPKTVQPTSFEERIEQLKTFKDKHGHVRVTERFDKKLASYCNNLRQARRKPEAGVMNISEERIKALDELGFEWNIVNRSGPKGETKTFEERVEQLSAYKEKNGNIRVAPKIDKSLSNFCKSIRAARRNPNSSRLVTDERIKMLDDIGFQWEVSTVTSFEERIIQLKEFKEKNGNLKVTNKLDKQLATWCSNMRAARRNPKATGLVVSEERITALDELGFEWEVAEATARDNFSFEEKIAKLNKYKEKNGHVKVSQSDDKNLHKFCAKMRNSRNEIEGSDKSLSDEMIKALDNLGFDWDMSKAGAPESFESRIEQLQAFKEQHGHLKVTDKLDKSLSRFCVRTRTARRNPEEGKSLSEEKIQALDQLGFDWDPLKDKVTSFEERMLQLSAFKEKNGHIRVTKTDDKSLGDFCNNVRRARREPGSGIAISEERISALDELGFDWGSTSSPPEQDIQEEEVGRTYVV